MTLLKVYRCKYCKTKFVAMETKTGSYLPVEVRENEGYEDDEIFNSEKHKSHLLNCKPRSADWDKVKKSFIDVNLIDFQLALNNRELNK